MASIYESEDVAAIRAQIRRYVEERVVPVGEQWEADGAVPRPILREMGELGFFGFRVPEDLGGLGLGPLASAVMAEELGRSTFGGFAATVLVHTELAFPYPLKAATRQQQERWFPGMLTGETIAAIAITEPDAGSDVAGIRTAARRDGAGWRLSGSKMFITNGVSADLVFVAARTNPEVKASRGLSIFAVTRGSGGFEVSRSLPKMGWRSSDTAELSFTDCWVPDDDVVGAVDSGFYQIMSNFQNERLVLGAAAIGEASRAIELTVEYVKNRMAFGHPLWSKQAIRQRLAMRSAEVEAGRQLVYHASWLMEKGVDAVKQVSMLKAYVGELTNRVMYDCVQFHGGAGYITGTAVERMYRDARIHSIGGGATEVMLDEIAKRM